MKKELLRTTALAIAIAIALCSCAANTYSGRGGMTAYKIRPEVYTYHYEKGFTGPDAMGWDPNLQYVWSRVGAAKTCGVTINRDAVLKKLVAKFGDSPIMHEMNGIDFHYMQSRGIAEFCTPARVSELKAIAPKLEAVQFPQLY